MWYIYTKNVFRFLSVKNSSKLEMEELLNLQRWKAVAMTMYMLMALTQK